MRRRFKSSCKTIFEIEQISIIGKRYPIRKTKVYPVGIYTSLERAENAMKQYVSLWDLPYTQGIDELCFFIKERQINPKCYELDRIPDDFVAIRTYFINGELYEENMVERDGIFRGRPKNRSFKIGDFVEAYNDGELSLAIVVYTPIEEPIDGVELEMEEDRYCLYILGRKKTFLRVQSQYVFPPSMPIPEKLQAKYNADLEIALRKEKSKHNW